MISHLLALTFQGNNTVPATKIQLPSALSGIANLRLGTLLSHLTQFLVVVAALLAFLFFVYGGFKWLMSSGDKKKVEEAQKTLQYAIIGLVLVLLSFFIINFIGMLFGVSLLKFTLP